MDDLPAESVLRSPAEGKQPRFEVCIKVRSGDGFVRRVHVKTFAQKTFAHYESMGQRLATEIETKRMSKRQALAFVRTMPDFLA